VKGFSLGDPLLGLVGSQLVNPAVTRRFCPKCHSENIILWMGGYTGAMYRCPDCGYTGPIVIETNDPIPSRESEERETE